MIISGDLGVHSEPAVDKLKRAMWSFMVVVSAPTVDNSSSVDNIGEPVLV